MSKTLIFIDPGYDIELGHYTREGELIREEAKRSGIELKHFVSMDVPEDKANEHGLIRRFHHKAGLEFVHDPEEALRDFYITLDGILKELPDEEGHIYEVLMYTGHPLHLPLVAFTVNKHAGKLNGISAHICIFYLDMKFCRGEKAYKYKDILNHISRLVETFDPLLLMTICSDSARTRDIYAKYFKRNIKLLPFPIEAIPSVSKSETGQPGRIKIGYLGNTIKRAGYDFVYEAYKEFYKKDILKHVEFKIKHTPREQLINIYRLFIRENRNITHITDFLSNDELYEFYTDCDIILLPYSKRHYPSQTSGVVVEAISKNKILIVPDDTWLADQINEYGSGETFLSDDLGSFISAIEKVVNDVQSYKEKSHRNINEFCAHYSASNLLAVLGLKNAAEDNGKKAFTGNIKDTSWLSRHLMKQYLYRINKLHTSRKYKKDSHEIEKSLILINSHISEGNHARAVETCKAVLNDGEIIDSRIKIKLMNLLWDIAPEEAEWECIRTLSQECIQDTWIFKRLMKMGGLNVNNGNHDLAEEFFKKALSIKDIPEDMMVQAVIELVQRYVNVHRNEEAEDELLKALKSKDISNESRHALLQALAYVYLNKKEHKKAETAFKKALAVKRNMENDYSEFHTDISVSQDRNNREVTELNSLGETLFMQGEIEGAYNSFIDALQVDPEDVTANNNIGVIYMQTGDMQKSIEHFTQALKNDPYNRDTTINCAELMKGAGETESAMKLYEAYLTVNPDDEKVQGLMKDIMDKKGSGGINIIYVPGFDSEEQLADQYYRMIWHMNPVIESIKRLYVPVSFDDLSALNMPPYMDPEIKKMESKFKGKIILFPNNNEDLWRMYLGNVDILMNWKLDYSHDNEHVDALMRKALQKKKKWEVDKHRVQQDGLMYLRMSHDANRRYKVDLQDSRDKFEEFVHSLGAAAKGYIFGTGPSLEEAMNYDFSDGITIACNSMVKNEDLLRHINPKAVVFGDPIFHGGCSSYAGVFRTHLYKVMERYNPYIIVPFRDYKLYIENLPCEYREKIIGIPTGGYNEELNLNLQDRFIVRPTRNILTLLLIPLATSIFKEIGIMGCDGRKMEDNQYFWNHHKASQFNDQMEDIKKAHPAFFDIDYDDYYFTHCEILEQWLTEAEKIGVKVENLSKSYIPALQKRSRQVVSKEAVG